MIYVGIDVSKDKHDCYIVNSDGVVLADGACSTISVKEVRSMIE